MPDLFPSFPVVSEEEVQETEQAPPKSIVFDFGKGDFATDAAGKMIEADEATAWVQWCMKAVYTQRYAFLAYGDNYGSESEEAFSQPDRKSQESAFERTITETLLADPYERTASVSDFSFEWKNDSLYVSFVVTSVDGLSIPVSIKL